MGRSRVSRDPAAAIREPAISPERSEVAGAGQEARRLLESGYERHGNGSLGQICRHLRLVQDPSIDGFPKWMGWFAFLRPLMRRFLLPKLLRGASPTGYDPSGLIARASGPVSMKSAAFPPLGLVRRRNWIASSTDDPAEISTAEMVRQAEAGRFGGLDNARKFEAEIELSLEEDAHLIVATIREQLTMEQVMGRRFGRRPPLAVSNSIFVDTDGNGFQPNGDELRTPLPRTAPCAELLFGVAIRFVKVHQCSLLAAAAAFSPPT
jgi:hypothetical protein